MNVSTTTHKGLAATMLLGVLALPLHAWEPNATELDAAISSGNFAGYLAGATTWLNQQASRLHQHWCRRRGNSCFQYRHRRRTSPHR